MRIWIQHEKRDEKFPEQTNGVMIVFSPAHVYETKYLDQLPKKFRKEHDWADEDNTFIYYKRYAIPLENFIRSSFCQGWYFAADTFFSGTCVRQTGDDLWQVGTYYSWELDPENPPAGVKIQVLID